MGVVIGPIDDWRAGDTRLKHIGSLHDGHRREVAAEGPAVNANPREIHLGILFAESLQAANLIGEREFDEISFNAPFPLATPRRRTASVNRHDDETVIGKPLIEQVAATV